MGVNVASGARQARNGYIDNSPITEHDFVFLFGGSGLLFVGTFDSRGHRLASMARCCAVLTGDDITGTLIFHQVGADV